MPVYHKAEHCDDITFFFPGVIPSFKLNVMTKTQQPIHHPNDSALLRGEQALEGESLPFSRGLLYALLSRP